MTPSHFVGLRQIALGCAAAAALLLAACGDTPPPKVPSFNANAFMNALIAGSALGTRAYRIKESPDIDLVFIEIPKDAFAPELLAEPGTGINLSGEQTPGIFVGSGFESSTKALTPLGLLLRHGEQLNGIEPHGYTRILGFNATGLTVVHRGEFEPEQFSSALQLGPGIIEDGAVDISEKDLLRPKYQRTAVATCEARWVVAATLQPMHLRTVGLRAKALFDAQHWECDEMVNLAGDQQALVAIYDGKSWVHYGDMLDLKVALVAFRPSTFNRLRSEP